jgi:hypothetical protein
MPFPLATVLAAAPSVIAAAADIIRAIKARKSSAPQVAAQQLDDMAALIERQAQLIEELAINNRNLALAVRNNRILAGVALLIGVTALVVALLW